MTCWDVLGIDPIGDKKAIKLAYAVLLKKNKPDENPKGFSALHSAYKEALHHAAANQQYIVEQQSDAPLQLSPQSDSDISILPPSSPIVDTSQDEQPVALSDIDREVIYSPYNEESHSAVVDHVDQRDKEVINAAHSEESPSLMAAQHRPVNQDDRETIADQYSEPQPEAIDIDDYINGLELAWQKITAATEVALEKLVSGDDIRHWHFIDDYQEMYDFQFKEQYSSYIFSKLFEFFENNTIKPRNRPQTLKYFGQLFSWLSQQENFEFDYGYDEVTPIFDVLLEADSAPQQTLKWFVAKKHVGLMEYANYYARLSAMGFDVFMMYMIVDKLPIASEAFMSVLYTAIAYIVLIPIAEASPMQGSVGKVLFGMKVTDSKGTRLNIFHAYWRQILYVLITAAFKVTVWINFFMNDGRLLHDRLSVSRVIKR